MDALFLCATNSCDTILNLLFRPTSDANSHLAQGTDPDIKTAKGLASQRTLYATLLIK